MPTLDDRINAKQVPADVLFFAGLILEYRQKTGMTQHEFADHSGINRVTIGQIESGSYRSAIKADLMARIAEAVDVPMEIRIGGKKLKVR